MVVMAMVRMMVKAKVLRSRPKARGKIDAGAKGRRRRTKKTVQRVWTLMNCHSKRNKMACKAQ